MSTTRLRLTAYTDYKSPYAYVAKNATKALALEYPAVELVWLPYTLRIAEYLDAVDARSAHNWRKVKYAYMDARRLANRQGLVLKGPKRIYEGSLASMGMLYAQRAGIFDAYHDLTFERFWKHDLDIDSMEQMQDHVARLGGSPDDYARYVTGPGPDENRAIVDAAEAAGVFGVPMLVLDGELFWGGDLIEAVKRAIERRLESGAAQARGAGGR
ncbi:MAG: DsbA family protein [Burkholderiales bacterium]|nr:DsbA family protein [Burkholderiales bacterium]